MEYQTLPVPALVEDQIVPQSTLQPLAVLCPHRSVNLIPSLVQPSLLLTLEITLLNRSLAALSQEIPALAAPTPELLDLTNPYLRQLHLSTTQHATMWPKTPTGK